MKREIVSKCVGTHEAWYPSPLVCTYAPFGWPPTILWVAHILNGWHISQPKKQITTFECRIHWNINIRKENIFFTKKNQKTNSTISVMLCMGANFANKISCLVARIVPYYTAGLHLLTFYILEPYPSKYIALGLSHVISY